MRRLIMAVSSIALLSSLGTAPVAFAQISIDGGDGNTVDIGPNGINVRTKSTGNYVRVAPGGVTVNGGASGADLKINRSAQTTSSKSKSKSAPKKTVTSTERVRTVSSQTSLESQVGTIEISVYGKKTVGATLVARLEKLELDNLGAVQNGTLKDRIQGVAKAVGVKLDGSTTTKTTTVTADRASTAVSGGERVNVSVAGQGGSSQDIVIADSAQSATYVCRNNKVILNASACSIRLKGVCSELIVNGSNNQCDCDAVNSASLHGSNNNLSCGSLNQINFAGSNNNATWKSDSRPLINDSGFANNARKM